MRNARPCVAVPGRLALPGVALWLALAMPSAAGHATGSGADAGAESDQGRPWRRDVRGVVMTARADDLTIAAKGEAQVWFSYAALEKAAWQRAQDTLRTDRGGPPNPCTRRITIAPVAWTGALLGVRQETVTSCADEAHPSEETQYRTFHVKAAGGEKPGVVTAVALTDWFAPAAIFRALRKDALVRRALAATPADAPASLADLLRVLGDAPAVATESACHSFPADLLQRFVIARVGRDDVTVRLGLPGAGPCRARLTDITLRLPRSKTTPKDLSATHDRGAFYAAAPPADLRGRAVVLAFSDAP